MTPELVISNNLIQFPHAAAHDDIWMHVWEKNHFVCSSFRTLQKVFDKQLYSAVAGKVVTIRLNLTSILGEHLPPCEDSIVLQSSSNWASEYTALNATRIFGQPGWPWEARLSLPWKHYTHRYFVWTLHLGFLKKFL